MLTPFLFPSEYYLSEHGQEQRPLNWNARLRIALGSARGLAYLHHDCCPKIVHRDIKSSNILLDENLEPHVSDFGLAKLLVDEDAHVTTVVAGTFGYLAPGLWFFFSALFQLDNMLDLTLNLVAFYFHFSLCNISLNSAIRGLLAIWYYLDN